MATTVSQADYSVCYKEGRKFCGSTKDTGEGQAGEIPEESNARQWEEQERSWEGTN